MLSACNQNPDVMTNDQAISEEITELNFIHTVFFWLKEGVSDEEKLSFEAGMHDLGKVSTIGKYYIATPADTERGVIDNTYDYAWIFHFMDAKDQAAYQTDSLHLEFIEKYNELWEEVKVYDSEVME